MLGEILCTDMNRLTKSIFTKQEICGIRAMTFIGKRRNTFLVITVA